MNWDSYPYRLRGGCNPQFATVAGTTGKPLLPCTASLQLALLYPFERNLVYISFIKFGDYNLSYKNTLKEKRNYNQVVVNSWSSS